MTEPIALIPLKGRNPAGLFAALGALDVATRCLPDRQITLSWADGIDPHAVIEGPDDIEQLIALCVSDVERWLTSPVLVGPGALRAPDLKVEPGLLRQWFTEVSDIADVRLLAALVAEGGLAKVKAESKPTHFHFTSGQQNFLNMVRELRDAMTFEHFREALAGPWEYKSPLPVLGWDPRSERIYALSARDPSSEKKLGVPGADWLGFLGLRFFPVNVRVTPEGSELMTTGCVGKWKSGTFVWPLWNRSITAPVVASLLARSDLRSYSAREREVIGVSAWLEAPIRRTDPGGYGSFGPATVELS